MNSPTIETVETMTSAHDEHMLENYIQHVAQSTQFMRAETLRKLLLYLWANRNSEISEYAIATEALGRRADFDPKTDASVRVQISRLRSKLKDFYEGEEPGGSYTLCIPMGTHTLTILENELPVSAPAVAEEEDHAPIWHTQYARLLFIITWIVLVVLSSWLLWDRYTGSSIAQHTPLELNSFWASVFVPRTPMTIILPTPTFFAYPKLSSLHVRDINVNNYQAWKTSDKLKLLAKKNGTPYLDYSYTVTSDTLAAIDLANYMQSSGVASRVSFEVSNDIPMNLLEKTNIIALGGYATMDAFRDYLTSMDFLMSPYEQYVANAHPSAGELPRYAMSNIGSGHSVEPGIVAALPGRAPNRKLLIMQAKYTNALVLMLTSKDGADLFQKMYAAHGSPRYFEMVVEYERDGGHIVRTWPVAMHAYTKRAPTEVVAEE